MPVCASSLKDFSVMIMQLSLDLPVRFQIKRSKKKRCDWLIIYVCNDCFFIPQASLALSQCRFRVRTKFGMSSAQAVLA